MKSKIYILSFTLSLLSLSNLVLAQYSVISNFSGGSSGINPFGTLISDGTYLYGTTNQGGKNLHGTVFKIKSDGSGYATILDFAGTTNGSSPWGSLYSDGTYLYGMTELGGTNDFGTIFKIKPDGTGYVKLLDFEESPSGAYPEGSLISDGTNLYGLTRLGGVHGSGVIFKIKYDGTGFTKLLDFEYSENGSNPWGTLVSDGTYLYGVTEFGGVNSIGTLFKIKTDGSDFSKLIDFAGEANGNSPRGTLTFDGTYLYGMTTYGGTNDMGTVFKIKPDGSSFVKLLDFAGTSNGAAPHGAVISDGTYLYGMTNEGGDTEGGVLFKLKLDGSGYSKLVDFSGTSNGSQPFGSLLLIGSTLYGMTYDGGSAGSGTIFKYQTSSVGIANVTNDYKVSIYPNPTDGKFTLQISEGNQDLKNEHLLIYNQIGQVVFSTKTSLKNASIDISNQPNGIYFLKIQTEKNTYTEKFFIK
jgi:uncharacterized repeat protein (TIGR03803 family)